MATNDERMKILRMLQQGDIDPDSAARMLHEIDNPLPVPQQPLPAQPPQVEQKLPSSMDVPSTGGTPRWLRVRVSSTETGRPRVNVRLPFGMVRMGLKLGARYAPELEGIDIEELFEAAKTFEPGPFVDVYDDEDGEHVEVFIE